MKKSITLVALLAGAVGGYAQGTVNFQTYLETYNIAVWSPNPASPTVQQTGNSATDLPAGGTAYAGVPLGGAGSTAGTSATSYGNGSDYSLSLYAVSGSGETLDLTDGSPDLVTTTHFVTTGGTGAANVINGSGGGTAGSWYGNAALGLPGTATGTAGVATVQLAAWYNDGGTITSYADAVTAGVPNGLSDVATLNGLGGPNTIGAPSFPVPLTGINSFSLVTTPEPSTIALGVIGACSFLLRRRKS
jgi:hypothetical protein